MTNSEVLERLKEVFHDVFDDPTIQVRPELSAKDVDEWDSLAHVRLMLTVEKSFGVKFTAAEVGGLKNVGDLVTLIKSKD